MAVSPIDPALCGTEANYTRHRRLDEKPCEPCINGASRAKLDRSRRYRERDRRLREARKEARK